MGTRHKQTVINKAGEIKVAQYGQWDGYPSGQGVEILRYLRSANLEEYQKNLDSIPLATTEQLEEIDEVENWPELYPYLSRDCGSNIHQMIENGEVEFVKHIDEWEANNWCDGFYTIDFSKNEFTSEFYDLKSTFKLDNLPTEEEYLEIMVKKEEE